MVSVGKAVRTFTNFISFFRDKKMKRKPPQKKQTSYLANADYKKAEKMLVKEIQREKFSEGRETLMNLGIRSADARTELRTKGSRRVNLNPFIDEDGVIRAGGRLEKAHSLTYDQKYPVMPGDEEQTESLIRHEHDRLCHAGTNHVFHSLRKRFHILGGRTTINKVICCCVFCQKNYKRATNKKWDCYQKSG